MIDTSITSTGKINAMSTYSFILGTALWINALGVPVPSLVRFKDSASQFHDSFQINKSSVTTLEISSKNNIVSTYNEVDVIEENDLSFDWSSLSKVDRSDWF